MANNNNINVMGVLNSITSDKTVARAEQIEITLFDGTKKKISSDLMSYIKGVTADQIISFMKVALSDSTITDDYLFICTESVSVDYDVGHIYFYDNSSKSISDITPQTGGSGSSTVGSSVKLAVVFPEGELQTNTPYDIKYTWASKNSGYGLVYCLIDGTINSRQRMQPGTGTWTISGMSRGSHKILIYVVDSGGISSDNWERDIQVGSLSLESSFNESTTYVLGNRIRIPYVYYTNDSDYINDLIVTIDDAAPVTTSAGNQGTSLSYYLTGMPAGIHSVTLQIHSYKMKDVTSLGEDGEEVTEQIVDVEKYSNIISLSVLVAEQGVLYASIIGSSELTIKEREKLTLTVRATYIGASQFTATLDVYKLTGEEWVQETKVYATEAIWYNGTNSFIVTNVTSAGEYKFIPRVRYTKSDETISPEEDPVFYVHVDVADTLHIDSIVDDSLILHLSATGKSNSSIDKNVWLDTSSDEIKAINPNYDGHTVAPVTLHNFNFTSNGWLNDDNGQTRLLINGGAYVEIDTKPLEHEVTNGLTFDIEFATEDILNSSARVVSCFDGTRGFWIDTENATLSNNNSKTELITTETEVTNTNIILRYDNYIDKDGNYVYFDAITGEETLDPTTMVDGVETVNEHKTYPVYMTYKQYTQTGPFQTNFPSNEKTRITFVIQRGEEKDGAKYFGDYQFACMCIYVNGVLTSIEKITDYEDLISVQFENGGKKITLGCDNDYNNKGKAEIYNLRLYNRALSMEEVLTNYISDIADPIEQNDMIRRNALMGTTSQDLPIMEFYFTEDDWKNLSKENKMYGRATFTNFNGDTENFDKNIRCQFQGTSTLAYAVKNYKIRLYDTMKLKNGQLVGDKKYKYDLGNGIKEYIFTLKADYMDSMLARNTATGNFVSDLGTELCPAQEYIPSCRTAVYGFPILLYVTTLKSRDANGELVPSAEDPGTRTLLGVYNFNLDKNCTDSLSLYTKSDIQKDISKADTSGANLEAFNKDYPKWDCMSFEGSANSDVTAGAFATDSDSSIYSDFEMRFEDIEDILDEGTKTSSGIVVDNDDSIVISDINSDINGTYSKQAPNLLVGPKHTLTKSTDDIMTDITGSYTTDYGFKYDGKDQIVSLTISRNASDEYIVTSTETAESRVARRYGHLKKFIQWVMACKADTTGKKFKDEFEKHCNLSAVTDYFLTVFVMLMADNFGKNVMWNTWGPVSQTKKDANPTKYVYTKQELYDYDDYIWYPQFYDMDTCLGLDNSGNMRFDVHEEIEQGVFNTSNSYFWTQFREQFADTIFARYKELRSYSTDHSSYTEKSFLEYFYDRQVSKISETNYNNNFKQKYLMHEDYLFMMHGRQYEFFRRWISQRLYFIDSYYEFGEDWSKESTVRVEYGDFATTPVTFEIQTYQPSYVAVKFTAKTGNTKKLKIPRGGKVTFQGYVDTATDQEVIIYMAPNIKTLGDISPYSPKVIELSRMTRLTSLCAGSEEHPNPNLSSISLGNNSYLTSLTLENCTAMTGQVDVSNCTNLQYISTKGSTIPYVKFNNDGGALEKAHFSYATTTVNLNNFHLLNEITFENLDKLTTLQITNCPLITGTMTDGIVEPGYIMNILNEWAPTDKSTKIELECYGNLPNYNFLDACSVLHENYGLTNRRINLSGQITYLGETIPDRYSTYSSSNKEANYFPELKILYPNVTDFSEMFAGYKNINAIISKTVAIKDALNNINYEVRYYWKDPKEDKFKTEIDAEYNETGYRGRQLKHHDDEDMKIIADEIKDRMSPFETATNLNNMFLNDTYLEYIHDDTFDHMNVANASTVGMFSGCENLKYLEMPRVMSIDELAFTGCTKLVIYIPNSVMTINESAFLTTVFLEGVHPVVLFEDPKERYPKEIQYVRDARFGIKRDEITGRAVRQEIIECPNLIETETEGTYINNPVTAKIKYFLDDNGKLIYDVSTESGETCHFTTWNCGVDETGVMDVYSNPLGISEMMYGSMKNISLDDLTTMAIPTYNITNISPSTTALYKEEISIAKLFYDNVSLTQIKSLGSLNKVILLTETNSKISNYFMQDVQSVSTVICEKYLTEIGEYAFANCNITEFGIQSISSEPHLTSIGQYAFSGARLNTIYIPDTVTYIGERAYEKNNYITDLKYSESMTYVPIGCFANCNKEEITTKGIRGFSSENLTVIRDYAFDNSIGLLVVQVPDGVEEAQTKYDCYWCNDTSKSKFLDYFPNLAEIGNSAFRGLKNIRTIKLNPTLAAIGSNAFIPPQVDYNIPTLLEWDLSETADYSKVHIYSNAFAGRQFDWNSIDFNGFTGIIESTIFIPKTMGGIDTDAFSPSSAACVSTSSLDYVISDADTPPESWADDYVQHYIEKIYNYYTTILHNDNESMYFLLNNSSAEYIKLLKQTPSINIPAYIENGEKKYVVKRIANSAMVDNDSLLNIISFGEGSELEEIGTSIFDTSSITAIYVDNTYDESGSKNIYIPETVMSIGEGTPFKQTSWYGIEKNDDFIYLNDVCLGYGENSIGLVSATTEHNLTIKDSTKVIYDNAFQNEKITTLTLPKDLTRIGNAAFANCMNLTSISFLPCENNLSYIGDSAFQGDFNLKIMRYTKALTHVGTNTTEGCSIWKYIFDQGCQLDATSEPIKAKVDNTLTGLDETVTFIKICNSMGPFFSPSGAGYTNFTKLSNVSELILGEYEEHVLDEVPEDELSESETGTDTTYYKLDLSQYYDTAYYQSNGVNTPIILHTTDSVFNAPLGTYASDINISKITTNLLDQVDVIRIIMGYKDGETHMIYAKKDFTQKTTASMYRTMFNNRVATTTITL